MSELSTVHYFSCPYCGATVSMILDLSIAEQTYVEDCEVCCRPIEIQYRTVDGSLSEFYAWSSDE
ncbi:MAG: CPXCG motif-containing cysteine-rich protein [Leptospirales bacterium]